MSDTGKIREKRWQAALLIAVWFGLATGLFEGFGLLMFQRINWENWGRTMLVSTPILWVTPLVDVTLFVLVAIGLLVIAKVAPRLPLYRALVFVLTTMAVYAWLAMTRRLAYHADLFLAIATAVAFSRWFVKHQHLAFRVRRATFPWLVAGLLLAIAAVQSQSFWREHRALAQLPPSAPGAPNVLVIVVDTLRADHMSTYGYSRQTTPNIDQFAREGVVFENAIAPSSWTLPSHASMLTGRYAYEHNADRVKPMSMTGLLPATFGERHPVLGEVFAKHGYRTAAFTGNRIYFNRYLGFARGFSLFNDFTAMDMIPRTVLANRLMATVVYHQRLRRILVSMGFSSLAHMQVVGDNGLRRRGPEINQHLLNWVDHDRSRPFFAFLNYYDVHPPYGPAHSVGHKYSHGTGTLVDEFDDGIADMDDSFGQLRGELGRRGLMENTFIIFTSDHGELLHENGLYGHQNALYRGLIQVPLIISKPGTIPGGVRAETPVTTSAIPATLLELLGWRGESRFPGPSLTELWIHPGVHPEWPHPLSELAQFKYMDEGQPARYGSMRSLVTSKWHYILHDKLGPQLYDWKNDRSESHNLAQTSDGAEIVRDFAAQMKQFTAR